jgi:hypothetical protein
MQNGMEWNYEDPTTATMLSGPVSGWEPLDPEKGAESWYERMFDFPKYGEHGKSALLPFVHIATNLRFPRPVRTFVVHLLTSASGQLPKSSPLPSAEVGPN